jgi:hypothetical protein
MNTALILLALVPALQDDGKALRLAKSFEEFIERLERCKAE